MFNKILLKGYRDLREFVEIAGQIEEDVYIVSSDRKYRVSGKSMLGAMLAVSEWNDDTWIETEADAYSKFEKFIEVATDDNISIHE